jgi:hypothetical protein
VPRIRAFPRIRPRTDHSTAGMPTATLALEDTDSGVLSSIAHSPDRQSTDRVETFNSTAARASRDSIGPACAGDCQTIVKSLHFDQLCKRLASRPRSCEQSFLVDRQADHRGLLCPFVKKASTSLLRINARNSGRQAGSSEATTQLRWQALPAWAAAFRFINGAAWFPCNCGSSPDSNTGGESGVRLSPFLVSRGENYT